MKSLDFSVSEDSESATPDIKVEITLPIYCNYTQSVFLSFLFQ